MPKYCETVRPSEPHTWGALAVWPSLSGLQQHHRMQECRGLPPPPTEPRPRRDAGSRPLLGAARHGRARARLWVYTGTRGMGHGGVVWGEGVGR